MHAAGAVARPARGDGGALMEPYIRPIVIGAMIFIVFNLLIVASAILVLAERKIMGFMQQRYGPYLVGPHGVLQPIADILKLVFKEELRPKGADKWLFTLAPILSIVTAFVAFATVPYGAETTLFGLLDEPIKLGISDVNVGVLVVFAVTSMGVYGIVLAGWSSNSKYSLFGGLRASAQMISYELAYATSLAAVILLAGSLSLREIVDSQQGTLFAGTRFGVLPHWYVFLQPIGFIIYVIAGVAETNRAPFDFPEAEQELVAGYNTEYSSVRFALFPQAEYINMVTMSAVATDLYLGGWHFPFVPPAFGWIVFLAKVALFLFVYIWVRWTVPRYRYDQLMMFGWKYLFPASVLNLIVTAALVLYFNA
jgi:NADH-quinone oxidoreductase subunit H